MKWITNQWDYIINKRIQAYPVELFLQNQVFFKYA